MESVKHASRFLSQLLRIASLTVLAGLLLMRLGPFCEVAAQAVPIASAMAGCGDGKSSPTSKKMIPNAACATPCMAVPGEALAAIDLGRMLPIAPWPSRASSMDGWSVRLPTPPPRTV